ncbi:hypothetical protein H6G86_30450 [Nostoc sp. FACHB-133]|nr:hypothetical protein [Nostoc sp. FACHB-133]
MEEAEGQGARGRIKITSFFSVPLLYLPHLDKKLIFITKPLEKLAIYT